MGLLAPIDGGFVHRFEAMASPCEIRVETADRDLAAAMGQAGEDEARRIEAKFSRYRSGSLLSQINTSAGRPDPATNFTGTSGKLAAVTITGDWKALVSEPGVAFSGSICSVSGSPLPGSTVTATTPHPTASAWRKAKAAARLEAGEPS